MWLGSQLIRIINDKPKKKKKEERIQASKEDA